MKRLSFFISFFALFFSVNLFSQQKINGKIVSENNFIITQVLVMNVSNNTKTMSNSLGEFSIEASEGDNLKFLKDGYHRTDKIVKSDFFNQNLEILLLKQETLIQEVKIEGKPTGNLERDSKNLDDSKKLTNLRSSLDSYMKSPLNEPLPKNTIPKSLQSKNFQEGQVNVVSLVGAVIGLIKKINAPKITQPNFTETQNFISEVKQKIDFTYYKKFGMSEENIDKFLLYAEKIQHLSKKYRKDFNVSKIELELKYAFIEYSKLNNLSD